MPEITGLSGTTAEGGSLTISGSGFSDKAAAAPLVFEKFEGGQKTSDLTNNATGGEMVYTETGIVRPRRQYSAKADYSKTSGPDGQWASFQFNQRTAARWFVSWWVYLPESWHWGEDAYGGSDDGLANIKVVRFFPTGGNYTNIDAVLHAYDNYNWKRAYEHEGSNDEAYLNGLPWFNDTFSLGRWHQFRCEYGENSTLDAADGTFKIWVDGLVVCDDTSVPTNVTGDGGGWKLKRPYVIGFWDSWGPVPNEMLAYFADVVVDESWARVELGDASTYEACTVLEYQPATAWSDGAVTVTLNLGALSESAAYVYVTDSEGHRSAGQALTLGGGGGGGGGCPVEPEPVPPEPPTPGVSDFSISMLPTIQTIHVAETTTFDITIAPVGDFAGEVTLSVSGASTGTSESFDPPSVVGGGTSLLTIVTSGSTPVGHNVVTVTGTSGALVQTTTAEFVINP